MSEAANKFGLVIGVVGLLASVVLAVWTAYDARWLLCATNCINTATFTLITHTQAERVYGR